MTNPNIRIKRSAVPGKRPSNSQMELGELALNTNDGRIFTKQENVGIGTTVTLLNVWTENIGGSTYYNDGFVGIGTTIPNYTLDVNGGLHISGISTFDGKIVAGNSIKNSNIINTLNYNSNSGIAAFRPINLIDSSAGIKISRNAGLLNGATIELQTWDVGIVTNYSYWDVNAEGGYFQIRDRKTNFTRIFISDSGNILFGANSASSAANYNELVGLGSDKVLNVIGKSYISDNVGIGTTNPTSRLQVQGDVLVSGVVTATAFNGDINSNKAIIQDLSGTNLNYTGIATVNNLAVNDGFDVYATNSTFHENLVIEGNLTVNGTQVILNVDEKFIKDKQIVLGFSTTNNVDDITANGGGFGIASTEGSPLVCLQCTGINTLPSTYKQLIWTRANTFGAGTTDAFLFNYAVGIGSTLVPNGVRLSVGGVQITDSAVNAASFTGSGANLTNLNASNLTSGTVPDARLSGTYTGISINTTGIITAASFTGSGANLTNLNASNVSSGTLNNARLPQNISVSGIVTAATFSGNLQNTLTLNTSGIGLSGNTTFNNSGASTFTVTSNATSANTNNTIVARNGAGGFVAGIVTATFVGNLTGNLNSTGVNTATTISGTSLTYTNGSITNLSGTNLNYTGISTLTNVRSATLNNTGVGTITTLNSTTGTITNLSGTNVNTTGVTTTARLNVGTGGTILTTTTSGFVGINTTIPGSTLAVGGTITELFAGEYWNVVTQADVGYGASQVPLNQYLGQLAFLDEYSPSGLRRTGGGFDDVTVNSDGFVGIGTTNPTSKLHIVGDEFVTGVITASNFFKGSTPVITGIGIGSTSINPGSGSITGRVGYGFTDINIVGVGVSVVGYGSTLVLDFNTIASARVVNTFTATEGQTIFNVTHNPGFVDVYVNGVRLATTEFVATNGTTVLLNESASAGDNVSIITYQSVVGGSPIVTPGGSNTQLQFNDSGSFNGDSGLTYNKTTKNLTVTGFVTATTFSGNLQNTLTLNTSGTGLSGSTTFNNSGASTFTVTSNATSANTNSTIVSRDGAGGFVAGIVTATDFNSASDLKLKENIQAIENPIDKILNINGVSFDWKETGKSSMGVIAQDVEKVLPELVNGTDSKTVNYNGLIGLLIEVVKEQQKEINILKERLS